MFLKQVLSIIFLIVQGKGAKLFESLFEFFFSEYTVQFLKIIQHRVFSSFLQTL